MNILDPFLPKYKKTQILKVNLSEKLDFGKHQFFAFPLPLSDENQELVEYRFNAKPEKVIKTDNYSLAIFSREALQSKMLILEAVIKRRPLKIKLTDKNSLQEKVESFAFSNFVNGRDKEIQKLVTVSDLKKNSQVETLTAVYDFVLNRLQYGAPIDGLYTYKEALSKKEVDCGGFAMLLMSLLSGVGIQSRLAVGYVTTSSKVNNLSMHVWVEVLLLNNQVFPLDPSIEWRRKHKLSNRQGSFGFVGSDRVVVSYGIENSFFWQGKKYEFPILQKPFYFG